MTDTEIAKLYVQAVTLDPSEIFGWPLKIPEPRVELERHLPLDELGALMPELRQIQVLGIFPGHIDAVAALRRFAALAVPPSPPRNHEWLAPEFLLSSDRRTLAVCVSPGHELVCHYASLLRAFLDRYDLSRKINLEARFYPEAAAALPSWTGLADLALPPESLVLLGAIDEFLSVANASSPVALSPIRFNQHFDLCRLSSLHRGGRSIYLLGFSFPLWGEMAGLVARALYGAGASELIYLGEAGILDPALGHTWDLLVPESFLLADRGRVVRRPFSVLNPLLDWARATGQPVTTGSRHLSVPTALETWHLRPGLSRPAPRCVDHAAAYLAAAAAQIGGRTGFSALLVPNERQGQRLSSTPSPDRAKAFELATRLLRSYFGQK